MFDNILKKKKERKNQNVQKVQLCRQKSAKYTGEASINTNDPTEHKFIIQTTPRLSNNAQPLAPGILRDFTREHLEPFVENNPARSWKKLDR